MIDQHDQHQKPLGDAQSPRRSAEEQARQSAVHLVDANRTQRSVAQALKLAPQTLSAWMNRCTKPVPRGRPPAPIDPVQKTTVTELLDSHGRSIGLPTLKRIFPLVPRAALHDLRDQWTDDHRVEPCRLIWSTPGTVWSADFTQAPYPIDGLFHHILAVRDLASHCLLLAAPCIAQSADAVVFHFRQLFRQHAAPLVLKTDNGSPFIAGETRELCNRHSVVNLLSPPLTPQYNGSIEATGGQLKTRAAILAQLSSCDTWTSDILEAARLEANALSKPWGPAAPTPDQRWASRAGITSGQRASLAAFVNQKTSDITLSVQRERIQKGLATERSAACAATVARTAIRQALTELGYLQIRRPAIMSTQSKPVLAKN